MPVTPTLRLMILPTRTPSQQLQLGESTSYPTTNCFDCETLSGTIGDWPSSVWPEIGRRPCHPTPLNSKQRRRGPGRRSREIRPRPGLLPCRRGGPLAHVGLYWKLPRRARDRLVLAICRLRALTLPSPNIKKWQRSKRRPSKRYSQCRPCWSMP